MDSDIQESCQESVNTSTQIKDNMEDMENQVSSSNQLGDSQVRVSMLQNNEDEEEDELDDDDNLEDDQTDT